jgi:hypothetical protein
MFLAVIGQLVQLFQVLRRLGYVLFLLTSCFLAQLHICLYIADRLGILKITSEAGFYPLYDGSKHAERFLICCGAFLWLGYILPNRKGMSLWAQSIWVLRPPWWVACFHAGCWILIWGPLANACALYEGMSLSGMLACWGALAGVYYVQVWQDIVGQIAQTQRIKAQRRRFTQHTPFIKPSRMTNDPAQLALSRPPSAVQSARYLNG